MATGHQVFRSVCLQPFVGNAVGEGTSCLVLKALPLKLLETCFDALASLNALGYHVLQSHLGVPMLSCAPTSPWNIRAILDLTVLILTGQ